MTDFGALFFVATLIEIVKLFSAKTLGKTKFWPFALLPVFTFDALPQFWGMFNSFSNLQINPAISVFLAGWHSIGGAIYAVYSTLLYMHSKKTPVALFFGVVTAVALSLAYNSNWILFDSTDSAILKFLSSWIPSTVGGLFLLSYLKIERGFWTESKLK